ncbi:MAG: DUF2807 domain-containing protein [Pyrinomonadaceae bacterium]|nr:DUF2807 domain-containing protein [Sphingobacteriaceae bacterium]
MKTQILHRLALTVLAFVVIIFSSFKSAHGSQNKIKFSELRTGNTIQKIVLNGNVEVFLTQGNVESLMVYDDSYSKNASVQWENGVLRIASYKDQKLSVWITVKNLGEIEAAGKSTIQSMNKLSTVNLSINLKDGAKAILDAQVFNLTTAIADSSKLELNGEAENQQINLCGAAVYDSPKFIAQNRSVLITDKAKATYQQDGKATSIKSVTKVNSDK